MSYKGGDNWSKNPASSRGEASRKNSTSSVGSNFFTNRGEGYDSEGSIEDVLFQALKNDDEGDMDKAARKLFAINKLHKPSLPTYNKSKMKKKSSIPINTNASQNSTHGGTVHPVSSTRKSFESEEEVLNEAGEEMKGRFNPNTPNRGKPRVKRAGSMAWAETATRMRRSIRMKPGMLGSTKHFEDITGAGAPIVRVKRDDQERERSKHFHPEQLRSQLQGIASNLTGESLIQAKLMGTKGFWSLGQLIQVNSMTAKGLAGDSQPLFFAQVFLLHAAKEICSNIAQVHGGYNYHGQLSADSVLFNRNLDVLLMKPKLLRVKGQFNIKRLQTDILMLGITLTELFCRRRIGIEFCPSAFKAQELEYTLGEGKVHKYSARKRKSLRRNKRTTQITTFSSLEGQIMQEVSAALDAVSELDGIGGIKKFIMQCFSADPKTRPLASAIMDKVNDSLEGLQETSPFEADSVLLEVLKSVVSNKKLMSGYIRGPRLLEFPKPEKINPTEITIQHDDDKPLEVERTDGIKSSAPPGYVTDDSVFVDNETETVLSEQEEDQPLKDLEAAREQHDIKQRLKAKGVAAKKNAGRKGTKPKSAYNKLRAFLSTPKDVSNREIDEMVDETKSNAEKATKQKKKGKASKNKKKKVNLAAFSTLNKQDEEEEEEEDDFAYEMEDFHTKRKKSIHSEVKVRYGVNADNLETFKNEFAAKKLAKKKKFKNDPEVIAMKFQTQQKLSLEHCETILSKAKALLSEEPNMLRLQGPTTVVGDIHGQFFDLRNMIKRCGRPGAELGKINGMVERQGYLFLGDYVDRGNFSCEVLFYLLTLKIKYPNYVWLLRGNHESKATSGYFGFKDECEKKYGPTIFYRCCEVFQSMPIAALVSTPGGNFFCLHGGISPNVRELHQFTDFDRFVEPQMYGFLCDVLWADPITLEDEDAGGGAFQDNEDEDDDEELDPEAEQELEKKIKKTLGEFYANPLRGCSFRFGLSALMRFLKDNNVVSIVRAHQVQQEGYSFHYQELTFEHFLSEINYPSGEIPKSPEEVCPPIITVFSAPNYCGKYGNKGAYLNIVQRPPEQVEDFDPETTTFSALSLIDAVQFDAVEEPKVVNIQNEKAKQSDHVEKTCPYMPTGFDDLIKRALSLQTTNFVKMLSDDAHEVWHNALENNEKPELEKKPNLPPLPARKPRAKKNSDSSKLSEAVSERSNSKTQRQKKREPDEENPSTWQTFEDRINAYEKAALKKYDKAQKDDRLNEMNPLLIEQTEQQAKNLVGNSEKFDYNLPPAIGVPTGDADALDDQASRQRASFNLAKLQEEKTVTFERKEIIALQTLFLLIDREQKGKIDIQDLVTWTENSGGFITRPDAEMAVEILDFDKDGYIGFEDYLVFAAAAKKIWMAEQFAGVITRGYKKLSES